MRGGCTMGGFGQFYLASQLLRAFSGQAKGVCDLSSDPLLLCQILAHLLHVKPSRAVEALNQNSCGSHNNSAVIWSTVQSVIQQDRVEVGAAQQRRLQHFGGA